MAPPKDDGKKIHFAEPSVSKSDELRAHLQKMSLKGDTEEAVPISFEDICAAAFRICKGVAKTPCEVHAILLILDYTGRARRELAASFISLSYSRICTMATMTSS